MRNAIAVGVVILVTGVALVMMRDADAPPPAAPSETSPMTAAPVPPIPPTPAPTNDEPSTESSPTTIREQELGEAEPVDDVPRERGMAFRVNGMVVFGDFEIESGPVVDRATGVPIAGATVTTPDGTVRHTDTAGTITIRGSDCSARRRVEKRGYATFVSQIGLGRIELEPAAALIGVVLTTQRTAGERLVHVAPRPRPRATAEPVHPLLAEIRWDEDYGPVTVRTDARGRFSIDALPAGRELCVTVHAADGDEPRDARHAWPHHAPSSFVLHRESVVLTPGEVRRIDIAPAPTATIRGTASDPTGSPVANSYVDIRCGDAGHRRVLTDASGHFQVDGIPAGRIAVILLDTREEGDHRVFPFVTHGQELARRTIDVAPGSTNAVALVTGSRCIAGRVLDDAGAPIPDARVTVDPLPGVDLPWRRATTDAEGRFRIDRLVDGAYALAVDPPDPITSNGAHFLPGEPHVVHAGDERVTVTIARGAALVIEHTGTLQLTHFDVCSCERGRDVRRVAFERLLLDRERRRWGTTVPAGRYACLAFEADEMLFAKVDASVGPDPIVVAANRVPWGVVRLIGAGDASAPVAFFDGLGDRIRVVTAPGSRPIALPAGRLRVVVDGRTHRVDVPAGGTVDVDVTTTRGTVPQQGQNPSSSP